MRISRNFILASALLLLIASSYTIAAQTGLQIAYTPSGTGTQTGIQTLSYAGVTLEDLSKNSSDAFHIWRLKMTDLNLQPCSSPSSQCTYGESNLSRTWNASTETMTYVFNWGSITTTFQKSGDTLNITVTETNNPGSGLVLDGAAIYPLALYFPQLPAGFVDPTYWQVVEETQGPGVTLADYGSGEVAAVDADATKPLYTGFDPLSTANAYIPVISSTLPDNAPPYLPSINRPVWPGSSDTFTASLQFAPSGTSLGSLGSPTSTAYQNWAVTRPAALDWENRQIIGTAWLADPATCANINQPCGLPTNPRRYKDIVNNSPNDIDIPTPTGLASFQSIILQKARNIVTNLQMLNAQGVITWDIEGQQFPQPTSYVCSPDRISYIAPEMESIVSSSVSTTYQTMKLIDAYFKTITDAGFRVGVCIRPQDYQYTTDASGNMTFAQQVSMPGLPTDEEVVGKMAYAHNRWGATLFYIDSTVDANGVTLDTGTFQYAFQYLYQSGALMIPEESTPAYYAYTAPFKDFLTKQQTGTNPSAYNYYPSAFSAVLVNDSTLPNLTQYQAQLCQAVKNGDIMMAHADYWDTTANPFLVTLYQNCYSPKPPGAGGAIVGNGAVVINAPANQATVSGSILVTAQINLVLDSAGSYLMVDGVPFGSTTVTTIPYVYPLDTTKLTNGPHTLMVWAHDISNNVYLSDPDNITVSNPGNTPAAPAVVTITSPQSGAQESDIVPVDATITALLDSAGSYLMVDGVQKGNFRVYQAPFAYPLDTTTLSNGTHTLQIWAHDVSGNTDLSSPITVSVSNTFLTALAKKVNGTVTSSVAITSPSNNATLSGQVTVTGQVNVSLDSAGSYLMVDANEIGTTRVTQPPFVYPLDTTQLSNGQHTLQLWAHDTGNNSDLSATVPVTVSNTSTVPSSNVTNSSSPVLLTYPQGGQGISGIVTATATITAQLDSAGSYLMVDGVEVGTARVTQAPYAYPLDTTTLTAGQHVLQIWAHTTNNDTLFSNPVTVTVAAQ